MKNRWKTFGNEPGKKPLKRCEPADLTPEETLYLALHVRSRFLDRIARSSTEDEYAEWVNAIAAGFANLLEHCNLDDLPRLYHGQSPWHETVQPPSVLAGELWVFLGGLSVDNQFIFESCGKRGSVQAFMRLEDSQREHFERGKEERNSRSMAGG